MVGRSANYAFSVIGGLVRADLGANQSPDQLASFFRILALTCQENGTSRLLIAARHEADALAKFLGLTRVTRFVSEFDLGIARTREDPEPTKKGYEIGVPIPLFDCGIGRVSRAEALYMQAANRIAEAAINGRSEVREAYLGYRTAYDVAKHYRDEVVPLRKQISDEIVLRYNGMLASVFELLIDAREQVAAVSVSIDAQRDFWLADSELQMALNGRSPGGGTSAMKVRNSPSGMGRCRSSTCRRR